MRLIKFAFISLLVFILIITALSLLIPSHIRISKAITISSGSDSVLQLIGDTAQWPRWHPMFQSREANTWLRDHNIELTPLAKTGSLVVVQWQQPGKNLIVNGWQLHRFGTADSMALQWYMDFRLRWYPWQKFGSLLYEGTYGRMMEQGLQNIKVLLQEPPASLQQQGL